MNPLPPKPVPKPPGPPKPQLVKIWYRLKYDNHFLFDKKKIYGKKGDLMKMITRRNEVMIVENAIGIRFAIHQDKLFEAAGKP